MTVELRDLAPGQWDDWFDRTDRAFGGGIPPEERAQWKAVTEVGRSIAAWDGDEIVGGAGAFSFRMSVPGGALVPTAGVTAVSVQPTHRRRGVLTSMMRRQLDDVRGRGEALAVLTASEPPIYGRFGYGQASEQLRVEIDTTRVRLALPEGVDDVRLRFVGLKESLEACEAVYARLVPGRPGLLARRPGWERQSLVDAPANRLGASARLCVIAEVAGEVRGYARYAVKPESGPGGPDGTVRLRDLDALDPVAYAALWRFLFGIDLTSKIFSWNRPADDPLLHLVSDLRRCHIRTTEGLFARLVDVGTALGARTYATPVDVVLDVADAFCPWNEGRWRLSGDAKGAVCVRTQDPADLALSVRELGTAYLGGFSLAALARAGRVRELRGGALREAAVAFRGDAAPWLSHGF
jgi:predicted acetyltransferase